MLENKIEVSVSCESYYMYNVDELKYTAKNQYAYLGIELCITFLLAKTTHSL